MNILFIPGLLCTEELWGELNKLRVKYASYDADMCNSESILAILEKTIRQLPTDQNTVVIAFSMGGFIALEMALRNYPWLKKLVLINTTADSIDDEHIPYFEESIKMAKEGKFNQYIEKVKGSGYLNPKQDWIELEERTARAVGPKAFIRQSNIIINRPALFDKLSQIQAKTLIISSMEDEVFSYKDSIQLYEQIKNSELILLKGSNHLSPIEKNIEITTAVTNFLES